MIIILILEVVAVAALIIFDGVLNSKYYEQKPITGLSSETYWAMGLMALTAFVWALQTYQGMALDTLEYTMLLAITQLVFHMWLIFVLARAYNAFFNLSLKYSLQYYIARFFLFLSITLEGLSVIGLLFAALRRYYGA